MHHWKILSIVSMLSILGFTNFAWADNQPAFTPNYQGAQNIQAKQVNFTLSSQNTQTFVNLIQQAELIATNLIQQGFGENPSIQELSISILGERNGQEAPLLMTKVSRADWQKQPIIRQWTQYFTNSAALLGFKLDTQPSNSPASAATPTRALTRPSLLPTPAAPPDPTTSASPAPPPPSSRRTSVGESLEAGDPGYR